MKNYSLFHVPDQAVLPTLASLISRGCANTAIALAYIAEADERRLYLQAAYSSMHAYCVGELHLSEDSAAKRIHAARAARKFPVLFDAVARGHLHLSAVCMLAPHLDAANVVDLIAAATHRSKSQIELLLAERFPKDDIPTRVRALPRAPAVALVLQHAPGHVHVVPSTSTTVTPPPAGPVQHAPGHVESPTRRARVAPLAPKRYSLQCTIDQETHDLLQSARELMSHRYPSGEVAETLKRALKLLVVELRKRKFAAASKPRACKGSTNPRYIPADVKRAVHDRDGGRCTFVSDAGKRCESRKLLEYDHIDEVARGGLPTVEGIRLRCRAHNQFAAERTFGAEFMRQKRQNAVESRAQARAG